MIKRSHTFFAGAALILLSNAVALSGVAYNRSEPIESQLTLTQRELQHSYRNTKDNSGITLNLNWRVAQIKHEEYAVGRWGMPSWLDQAKLIELGFDVNTLAASDEYRSRYKEALPREALLVLELSDAAYQQTLQQAKEDMELAQRLLAENPSEEFKRRSKYAEEKYADEQQTSSRLFVIDAGLNLEVLRAKYTDRKRYAIVHGLIRPSVTHDKGVSKFGGYISELHADAVNVPLAYRSVFENDAPYDVTVAFGKRLEPWITAATKHPALK
ncbi:MAG: DUF4824 family protein [Gallionella sp.]|nr:DUF4824 family protein [Gallionella sp.]